MGMTRVLENIPDSEVDEVVGDFESEGATVVKEKENGTWRVTATFPNGDSD